LVDVTVPLSMLSAGGNDADVHAVERCDTDEERLAVTG
jgi:hypothetical protein